MKKIDFRQRAAKTEERKRKNFNFAHDFYGIVNNINREKGFPATDFGFFVPRFAGR